MKTLIIILLLTPVAGFAQSKKELNAALAKQIATNDSLELVLKKQLVATDSLKTELALQLKKFGYQLTYTQTLENNVETIKKKLNECTAENSRLTEELENSASKGKPVVQPKTKKQEDNPFGGNGGNGPGKGAGIGNDDGKGIGPDTGKRYLIKSPDVSKIESDETCTVAFTIRIDENGNIVGTPEVVREKTTTTDDSLIKKVAEVVKTQAKYNTDKGSAITKKQLIVRITAN